MNVEAHTPTIGKKSMTALLREVNAERFGDPPTDSFTVRQYAEANGLDQKTSERRVHALVRLGEAKRVGTFSVFDATQHRKQFTPHFAFTKKQPGKK